MFIFLDTETTGNGPDDRLCQIAFKPENGPAVCELFNPGKPISIDAMVVHHITEKMVADKPTFKESDEYEKLQKLVSDINNVIVAHNAQFDMKMLQMEGINTQRVICTIKLARYFDFLPFVYTDANLTKNSISFRISDHYPLWAEFMF